MILYHILFSVSVVFALILIMTAISSNIDIKINNNNHRANSNPFLMSLDTTALAQVTNSDRIQQWIDKENNAKIIFSYDPGSPIIGQSTKLLFGIQDLRTGAEIKEGLEARLIITNGRDILKIINSTFTKGNFSINYAFPDSGSYQIISRIDSKNYSELASFNVFVPSQASSSTYKSFVSLMLYYVIPATSSAAGIAIYLSHKKKI
jgi:hypothetical protein